MTKTGLTSNKFGGNSSMYAFTRAADEDVRDAVIRAAQIVMDTGLNRIAHYKGTNHVMANNAASAFSPMFLSGLEKDADTLVASAAKLLSTRMAHVSFKQNSEKRRKAYALGVVTAKMGGQMDNSLKFPYPQIVQDFVAKQGARVAVAKDASIAEEQRVGQSVNSLVNEFAKDALGFLDMNDPEGGKIANSYKSFVARELAQLAGQQAFKDLAYSEDLLDKAVDQSGVEFVAECDARRAAPQAGKYQAPKPR